MTIIDTRPETAEITYASPEPCSPGRKGNAPGLDVIDVSQHVGDKQTLHNVTFTVLPGEIVAIAGGSGSGKTTLLETIVGMRSSGTGWVLVNGEEFDRDDPSTAFGFVPQDDIIHLELPLRRTLEHAARLRMPAETTPAEVDAAVTRTLERLDLSDRADVAIGSLSGGQRKRASIASELLTDPRLFFLDEPTSGLDPATGAGVMQQLRGLADCGTTIVLTTHAPADLAKCDRVVFLARDGHLAFVGSPAEAREHFDVDDIADIYEVMAATPDPAQLTLRFRASEWAATAFSPASVAWPRVERVSRRRPRFDSLRQWRALTRRNVDLLLRNKLTLAILAGSPAMVVGMMAVLFQPGTFSADQASAMPAIQTLFWVAFASFFFGVTYGLLQIVGEFTIFRRERFGGLSPAAYVLSKVAVLTPLVAVVNVMMLAILRGLGQLPGASTGEWAELTVTLILVSIAALSMGLLASAGVQNPAQATLALPMLCFPQVLFAGAVVPIGEMAGIGRFFSFGLADRWGFESLGRTLRVDRLISDEGATAGYLDAFTGSAVSGWIVLAVIIVISLVGTIGVLHHRTRVSRPGVTDSSA